MKLASRLIVMLCLVTAGISAQNIAPAPADKAVVYFVRYSSLGFAINFTYFDSTRLIGRFNGPKYIRYECEPGAHLFWARSENRDFVEANLEAGKIYFIVANPRMGVVKAQIELVPLDPSDKKTMKKVLDLLAKKPSESFSQQDLQMDMEELKDVAPKGIEKYKKDKANGTEFPQLSPGMFYDVQSTVPE